MNYSESTTTSSSITTTPTSSSTTDSSTTLITTHDRETTTGSVEHSNNDIVIPLAASLSAVCVVIIIIVVLIIICRRRSKRPQQEPPILPPPYPPVNDINGNMNRSFEEISNESISNGPVFVSDETHYQNRNPFIRSDSVESTTSGYEEPTKWNEQPVPVTINSEDCPKNSDDHDLSNLYIDMSSTDPFPDKPLPLPHQELVYSESEILNQKTASQNPVPCAGPSKKHGYVNVPNSSPADNSSFDFAKSENQLPGYANLQNDGKAIADMNRNATLPKYANVNLVMSGSTQNIPKDDERNRPKPSPEPRQSNPKRRLKVVQPKQTENSGPSIIHVSKKMPPQPCPSPKPQMSPKPNNLKQTDSTDSNHSDQENDDTKDYVNVSKLQNQRTFGCKEDFPKKFHNKKDTETSTDRQKNR